jgi:hypothetical protein
MRGDLLVIQETDPSVRREVPESRRGRRNRGRTVRGDEGLRRSLLEFADEKPLTIRLQPTFDFVDNGYGMLALVLFGNRERCKASGARAPA